MAESRRDKVGRLLEEAREVPPGKRRAFLEEACEEEPVRKEVLSLLEAIEEAPGFFENLAAAIPAELLEGEGAGEGGLRTDDPLDLEGTRVGRYAVEEHLGGGGMGVVYKARDPELGRPVALKFLPPHLATSEEAEERFVREARAASALEHPHIATVYEIGKAEEGQRFIAMAYYEGETLKEKLAREGRLSIEEALKYAIQIAEALARAHEAGIVHRDVKPANVMVTEAGETKLVDFGLAKAAAETRLTAPGQQMGTAAYMSPEQAEGKAEDGRTDLWALGVLLYEMLAGERPFRGKRKTAIIHSILQEEPPSLRDRRPEIPAALERVVGRCLQKDPGERYASAERLLEDLRALGSEARSEAAPAEGPADPREGPLGGSEEASAGGPLAGIRRFVRELRRRRVLRVAAVYAGTAFVILQLGEILVEPFGLPGWTLRLVTFLLVLGFPLAVGLAWTFDITEEGLVRTGTEGEDVRELGPGGKPFTSDAVIISLLVVIAAFVIYPRLTGPAEEPPSEEVQGGPAVPQDTATARLGPRSVAVLPFTYLAAEDSTDYFSIGMTDELIMRLSQVEDLPVIARTSVMRYQDTEKPIPQIGKELGVAHLVEGSVQKAGGKVRIQTQLIDARSGKHLWAEGFTRPFRDVLGLQVDLARRIAGELKATLKPETTKQMASGRNVDSTAYRLYLQARELRFEETGQSLARAARLLRRSIAIDSTFAPAWALLSFCAEFGPTRGGELPAGVDGDSLAVRAARRALELDSTSAEAHIAMGILKYPNFPAVGPHLKRALELNPGLPNAHRELGLYLMRMARFEAAEPYLRRAAQLDPASVPPIRALGGNDLYRGRPERAKRHLKKALSLHPGDAVTRVALGLTLLRQDSAEAGLRYMRQAAKAEPRGFTLAHLGWAYSQVGRVDSTKAILSRLQRNFDSPFYEGTLYVALGETKRALDLLEQKGGGSLFLKSLPFLDPVREEPRFQRLLRELGLDEATVQQTMKKLDLEPPPAQAKWPEQTSGST